MMNGVLEKVKKNRSFFLGMGFILLGLFLFSHNSPFYGINEDFDINIDISAGRVTASGKLPYLDYFTHRGPGSCLYVSLVSLFPGGGYVGLFLLEIISVSLSYLMIHKTVMEIFQKDRSLYVTGLFYLWFLSDTFGLGGKCEEIWLCGICFGLWSFCQLIHGKPKTQKKRFLLLFLNGLVSGGLFCIKFTFTGIYVGFLIALLIHDKKIKPYLYDFCSFMAGMSIFPLLFSVIAACLGCFGEMFHGYVIINLFGYHDSNTITNPLLQILKNGIWSVLGGLLDSSTFINAYAFLSLGIFLFCYAGIRKKLKDNSILWILAVFNFLPAILGNGYAYYLTITLPFGILGILSFLETRKEKQQKAILGYLLTLGVIIFMFTERGIAYFQYRDNIAYVNDFVREIKQSDAKSILNIYMETPIGNCLRKAPEVEYYCYLNANPVEIKLAQIGYLQNKETKYVIQIRDHVDEYITDPYLKENYDLCLERKTYLYYEGDSVMQLWKRKE